MASPRRPTGVRDLAGARAAMKRARIALAVVAVVTIALAIVAARAVLTASLEREMLARPDPPRPAERFDPAPGVVFEQEVVDSGDDRLAARWARPAGDAPRASVFIAHGGQPERIDDWRGAQQWLALHGVESFAFDYAGFGESLGAATMETMPRDTRVAWEAFAARIPAKRAVFVLALSAGCSQALATLDAYGARPRGVVLLSCFTSARDFLADSGRLRAPWNLIVADLFDNLELAPALRLPLLQVHGAADRVVPLARARRLHAAFGAPKRFVAVPDAGHDDAFAKPDDAIWAPILDFIEARSRPAE